MKSRPLFPFWRIQRECQKDPRERWIFFLKKKEKKGGTFDFFFSLFPRWAMGLGTNVEPVRTIPFNLSSSSSLSISLPPQTTPCLSSPRQTSSAHCAPVWSAPLFKHTPWVVLFSFFASVIINPELVPSLTRWIGINRNSCVTAALIARIHFNFVEIPTLFKNVHHRSLRAWSLYAIRMLAGLRAGNVWIIMFRGHMLRKWLDR